MFSSLEEVQKYSSQHVQNAIIDARKLGKDSFYILELLRTIGMDKDTKYNVAIQISDKFSRREIECLGFNTMLTHFKLSPKGDKYIAKTLYHVLDREQVMMISNIKESAFVNMIRNIDDERSLIAIKSSREHAKRLLSGKRID